MLGSKPELSWNQPCSDFVTPSITGAWLQSPRCQEKEFASHLFSAFPSGEAGVKVSWNDRARKPLCDLSANGDPEGRDLLRSHGWGGWGRNGAGEQAEPHPPTFQPQLLVSGLAFLPGLPTSPTSGTCPSSNGGKATWSLDPGCRTHSSDGCWGTAPSTGLQRGTL